MAHMPRIMGGLLWSVTAEISECEPFGEGVEDLVRIECERGEDLSGEWKKFMRDFRSRDVVEKSVISVNSRAAGRTSPSTNY